MFYHEISARTGYQIEELFEHILSLEHKKNPGSQNAIPQISNFRKKEKEVIKEAREEVIK